MTTSLNTLGARILQIRTDHKLTQEKFAKRVISSRSHISGVETNSVQISAKLIKLICIEFNVTEKWLKEGSGEKYFKMTSLSESSKTAPVYALSDSQNLAGVACNSEKKYHQLVDALGPGGAAGEYIPFLDYPDLIDIINYLQFRFAAALDLKEQLYLVVKFENSFPDYKEKIAELKNTYLSLNSQFDQVAEQQVDYLATQKRSTDKDSI
jgi:transcriptional regulator with XRE-family HTH domain